MKVEIGGETAGRVCIVVDVLRASSTIVTLLERGCERVVAAADIAEARSLKERLPDHLLCGEARGLPPDGFDYGNSPLEFSRLDLAGRSVVLATTNGTRALARVADGAAAVLVGCLLNASAVTKAAVGIAEERGTGVTVVCAGDADDDSSEDDLAVARAIVALADGRPPGDAAEAVRQSTHAESLRRIGLGADVEYCARADVSEVAPVLRRTEDGLLSLVRLPEG